MTKLTLNDLTTLENQQSAISTLNLNSRRTEDAFENVLSRDGTSPNAMEASLDMNSNRILNLVRPLSDLEPVRKVDFDDALDEIRDDIIASAGGVTPNIEVPVFRTPDRLEQVSIDSVYQWANVGGFMWKKGAEAPLTFNRTSADGAIWHLAETNLYPEIWGDEYTGRGIETDNDAPALNMMADYGRALSSQGGLNPTKPVTFNLRGGAHYVISETWDLAGMSWSQKFIYGNGATVWARCKDVPALDAVGSSSMTFKDLTVRGDRTERPTYGIQFGRETPDAARPAIGLDACSIIGFFSKAAVVNSASEISFLNNTTVSNRDNRRSSFAYVIDSNNTMDLDTLSNSITGFHRGLHLSGVSVGAWSANEIIVGAVSGARRIRRSRSTDDDFIGVQHVTDQDSPYFGLTNNDDFEVNEAISGQTSGMTGIVDRISWWSRRVGDEQSTTAISHTNCDFRKADALGLQKGTGYAIAIFGGVGETGGQVKQLFFTNCYSPVMDCSNILLGTNLFNSTIQLHCETQQPTGQTPTLYAVVTDASNLPITTLQIGETLTGVTSGITGVVTGYLDDDTDYVGDAVALTVTPAEVATSGTITVTAESVDIVGTLTDFAGELERQDQIMVVDTGEILTVQSINDNETSLVAMKVSVAPQFNAVGSDYVILRGKFHNEEVINGSMSGAAVGRIASGYGPMHLIEVTETGAVWMEDVEIRDHNPHAYQYVIGKRGTTLAMNNCRMFIRSTHHNIPAFRPTGTAVSGSNWGNIDYHGQLWFGEGGNQLTTELKNLSTLRRFDGILFTEALGTAVTLPLNGDSIIMGNNTGTSSAKSNIHVSGTIRGDYTFSQGTSVVAAATADLNAAGGNLVSVTGNTTITSFGVAPTAGVVRWVRFTGTPIITHNASTLALPTAANITAAVGDTALFISTNSAGAWRCYSYLRGNGTALA